MPVRHPYSVRNPGALQQAVESSQRTVSHTMRSFAEQVKSTRGTIDALCKGRQETVTKELAGRIAFALGVRLDDLFVPTEIATAITTDAPAAGEKGDGEQ